ncbi:hypothetical protein CA54_10320 [Symmachiella macrocystis]|uniref:Uncharacterized protein n=1 Tax=Symmachiella macrocystis TaxID=2527985 RepID=A0A5C6BJ72_9PLAN|nr:hypothetical protein CA54_10320 [Symmachiella macrocystis]
MHKTSVAAVPPFKKTRRISIAPESRPSAPRHRIAGQEGRLICQNKQPPIQSYTIYVRFDAKMRRNVPRIETDFTQLTAKPAIPALRRNILTHSSPLPKLTDRRIFSPPLFLRGRILR